MTTSGQARNFFPAFRVFIFGEEVTEDVLSVTVSHDDARAPSTAEIVLSSKDEANGIDDRYIITDADMLAMRTSVPLSVELPDKLPALKTVEGRLKAQVDKLVSASARQAALEGSKENRRKALANAANINKISTSIAKLKVQFDDLSKENLQNVVAETETAADDIRRQITANLKRAIRDPVKQRVLSVKVGEVQDIGVPSSDTDGEELVATVAEFAALRGKAARYPMQSGECIFHSNDPVRIFFREPRSGSGTWYHMFAGFVSDWVDDVDVNKTKTVTLRCEDVLRTFRYARFSTSPGLIDIDAVTTDVDLVLRTFSNDDFTDLTLTEFLFSLVFGFNTANTLDLISRNVGDDDLRNLTGTRTKRLVGANMERPVDVDLKKDAIAPMSFARSLICVLGRGGVSTEGVQLSTVSSLTGLEVPVDALAVYQTLVDHEVRTTDLKSMLVSASGVSAPVVRRTDPNTGTTHIEDVITTIGRHPELYPVDGGRLIMLAPSTLGVGYNLGQLLQDFKGVELKSSFKTRLEKIYAVLEHVEFSFYATGRGDILAEMPLNDFDPDAFGTSPVTTADIERQLGQERAKLVLTAGQTAGPYAPYYKISTEDTISWSKSFNDEQVKNLVVSYHSNIPLLNAAQFSDATGNTPARRFLPSLIPMFGVRMEEVPPTVTITDRARAELYCQLMLNRYNGDARQVQVAALPMLRAMPNRPMLFSARSCVATVREVSQSLVWGSSGDMNMQIKVNYVRGWDGGLDTVTGKPTYAYYGGYRANPLDYALLLKNKQPAENLADLRAALKAALTEDQ